MKNEYLKNPICDFEPLFDINYNKKINIVSTCFFKMNAHYKKFDTYVNGLKRLINLIASQNKYVLRIFIDSHIKNDENIFKILTSSDKVQIVLFKCSNYMDENKYHLDLFPTLIRAFTFFSFDFNDANDVIMVDIDLNLEDLNKLKILMNYETKSKEMVGAGTINNLLITKYLPHFYCYLFGVYNVKFDKSIILNFIANAPNIIDKGMYGKRLKPFGFGVDELFLNEYFVYYDNSKYIQDVKLGMILNYDVNWFIYQYKDELLKDLASLTYKNLRFILGKFYKPNMSSEQMFSLMDKLTYQIKSKDKNKIYISNQYYKLIRHLMNNNLEWFSKEHIKLTDKNFSGIVDCMAIFYYNPTNLHINDVVILKKNIVENNRYSLK